MAGKGEVGNLAVKISMDSTGFNAEINGLSRSMKVVQSEFKSASASLGGFGKSTEQLNLKAGSLNQQIELQGKKVQALEKAFKTSAETKGMDAKATQDLQVKLNLARAAMSNMEHELTRTTTAIEHQGSRWEKFKSQVSGSTKSAESSVSGMRSHMTSAFSGIGAAALSFGAAIGVGMGMKELITASEASETRLAQLDAVLKSTGGAAGVTKDEVLNLAAAQGGLTKFSKGANIETANLLLTFTGIGKKVFPEALTAVNDMSTALGQDTKSSAIQLGKALNDPIKGITALSRVGVSFTEEQKDVIKKLQETGDTAGAQAIILAELTKEFGGSAEAAGKTLGGQLTILQHQFGGVSASLGNSLLPYLSKFTEYITAHMPEIKQTVTDVVEYVIPKFKEWGELIGEIASKLFPELGKATDGTGAKAADLAKGGMQLVTDALTWIRDNIGLVKDGVMALTAALVLNKVATLASNVVMVASNVAMAAGKIAVAAYNVVTGIATAAQWGYVVAMDSGSISLGVISAAQWLFNAALDANPIGVVIVALAALGLAIYEVVNHWKDICEWIGKAWNWLTKWNNTPAEDKDNTVTTWHTDQNTSGEGSNQRIGGNAEGTNNWRGGLTWVGEKGPELINLARGAQVFSNPKSMDMARGQQAESSQPIQVNLHMDGKVISQQLFRLQQGRLRSLGVSG